MIINASENGDHEHNIIINASENDDHEQNISALCTA